MSVERAFDALAHLERQALADQVTVKVKGIFRPKIVLEASDGDVLGEIRSGPVFNFLPHRANCRLGETDVSLDVSGFAERSLRLGVNGCPLLSVSKRMFSFYYLARDGEGNEYKLRQRGRPWDRRFELVAAAGGGDLLRFHSAPLRWESSLSIYPQDGLRPGLVGGLALLLYYHGYLSLRSLLLSGGAAGGGGR
jgi:hypothetical protein